MKCHSGLHLRINKVRFISFFSVTKNGFFVEFGSGKTEHLNTVNRGYTALCIALHFTVIRNAKSMFTKKILFWN